MSTDNPLEYLKRLGESGDGPHDIARAALMLAILDHKQPLERRSIPTWSNISRGDRRTTCAARARCSCESLTAPAPSPRCYRRRASAMTATALDYDDAAECRPRPA